MKLFYSVARALCPITILWEFLLQFSFWNLWIFFWSLFGFVGASSNSCLPSLQNYRLGILFLWIFIFHVFFVSTKIVFRAGKNSICIVIYSLRREDISWEFILCSLQYSFWEKSFIAFSQDSSVNHFVLFSCLELLMCGFPSWIWFLCSYLGLWSFWMCYHVVWGSLWVFSESIWVYSYEAMFWWIFHYSLWFF